ncbi:hypothetical protein SAMN05421787_101892 [Virgibacillus pantothenticus]|uniref:Uncharacterized protein n=1 Tax=Virgibacillus pantothenticus TaxID=1473 RepID=A0A0L0QMK5_VIRPA|nr:hypothetical protein AFK71_15360 [Virgibacillus pantothenticus]SIS62659.1 hypothetical protein SAMN05421787_101892 [Virgibacillus pantothenticus]
MNKGAGRPFSNVANGTNQLKIKESCPYKQGYADVWAASPFLVGLPLRGEPMMPYRRAHL